jgi:hypothetical protein
MPLPDARPAALRLTWGTAMLLLVIAGCTSAIVSGVNVDRSKSERIYDAVQHIRGLNFKSQVPLVAMSPAQADVILEREVTARHNDAALARSAAVGAMTGLYAPGTDLKAQTMRLLTGQVAGFYDPEDREMILIEGHEPHNLISGLAGLFRHGDSNDRMLIAHELTHALQDQYFDIHAALDRIRHDDDRQLALKAVAEGDATLTAYGYVKNGLGTANIDALLSHLDDMPRLLDAESPDTPEALRESLIFQYAAGTHFVSEAYRRGGWSAVNALYANPPTSTRQVIDPTAYFDQPSPPVTITLRGFRPALKEWRPIEQNTYGELLVRVILRRNPSDEAQVSLARGWRGDRMAVLQRGDELTVIWIIVLRDRETAAAFARVYGGILDRIPPNVASFHRIKCRGDAVLAAIGPGAKQFGTFAPAVWRESIIGKAPEVPETRLPAAAEAPPA